MLDSILFLFKCEVTFLCYLICVDSFLTLICHFYTISVLVALSSEPKSVLSDDLNDGRIVQ